MAAFDDTSWSLLLTLWVNAPIMFGNAQPFLRLRRRLVVSSGQRPWQADNPQEGSFRGLRPESASPAGQADGGAAKERQLRGGGAAGPQSRATRRKNLGSEHQQQQQHQQQKQQLTP